MTMTSTSMTTPTTATTATAIASGRTVDALLAAARRGLLEAAVAPRPEQRFVLAYRAALRAATAVLAVRARSSQVRSGPRGVWRLLAQVAPDLTEWADFFSLAGGTAIVLETGAGDGSVGTVSERQADDLLRDAEQFCARVAAALVRAAG